MENLDSADRDALESLVVSEGWLIVAKRVRQVIEDKRDELERGEPQDERKRGFIAACRMFLALPETITGEIKQGEETLWGGVR